MSTELQNQMITKGNTCIAILFLKLFLCVLQMFTYFKALWLLNI